MGVAHWSNPSAPERKNKVIGLLTLPDLYDSVLKEGLVSLVRHIKSKELTRVVMFPIHFIPDLIREYSHIFVTVWVATLGAVVNDVMPSVLHHFAELESLLCVSARCKVFVCARVGEPQYVESKFH